MNIIVKRGYSDKVRRAVEIARQNLSGYYKEECKKGSRFYSKLSKEVIKKVYEEATNPDAVQARDKGQSGGAATDSD